MKKVLGLCILLLSIITLVACDDVGDNTQQETEYIITFNVDGGSPVQSITKKEDATLGTLPTVTKDGFTFEGWFINSAKTEPATAGTVVTGNLILYAKWTANSTERTLIFNTDGGTTMSAITVEDGGIINEPTKPTKEGYRFVGWTTDQAGNNLVTWPITLTSSMTIYAIWNEKVAIVQYLQSLLNTYKFNPQEILPEKMQAGGKLTTRAVIETDYTNFVNINSIEFGGYGEQWQMVLDNLEQAGAFFSVLSIVDTISSASVVAFNNYLDNNPSGEADYEFTEGNYKVHITFEGAVLAYIVEYTANIPLFGEQVVQIYLEYNVLTSNKSGRIQIGDDNAIKYEVNKDGYTIASKYLGFRTSYIEVTKSEDGSIEGKIHEHMTVAGKSLTSAAQFYIADLYATVVGNKAGAMLGFGGTIVEVYNPTTGILLGYKVKESLSSIVYNTFFFNLSNQSGISNIKYTIEGESETHSVFVNDGSTKFVTRNFGGLTAKTLSRRYDIEFRTQYFYVLENNVLVKAAVEVPMLFVQAEKYSDLEGDIVERNNNISTFDLNVSVALKTKIETDYETLIPIFDTKKESINFEYIQNYIGTKVK